MSERLFDVAVPLRMSRTWAMPSPQTFSIPPIADLLARIVRGVSVDPFSRNSELATWSNDLDPSTAATHHYEAEEFCRVLAERSVVADTLLFDPPYSPRQISEVYQRCGLKVGMRETQNARLYKSVRDGLHALSRVGTAAVSCGWNSAGFGKTRGYEIEEVMLVAHGGAHNDTIVVVERRVR